MARREETTLDDTYRIAVIGGTGPQGKGLGYRFAKHGHTVVLGSRAAEKARGRGRRGQRPAARAPTVTGAANADACADADVVLLAVPYDGHDELVAAPPARRQDGHLLREPARPSTSGARTAG